MIAIYTRLSKQDEESNSIKNQIREGKEFANKLNEKYIIYNEGEGISGGLELHKRPKLFELYNDIKKSNNKITKIWFRNMNRFQRNEKTYILFLDACIKNNVELYFENEKFDNSDPNKKLTFNILKVLNEYQLDLQSHQTKKTLLDNVKMGKVHGVPAFGYKADQNGFLMIDEEESKLVKWIFDKHLQGNGTDKIAELLFKKGISSPKGKRWTGKVIQDILKNTIHKGKRYWQGKYYDVEHVISAEQWEQNQLQFEKNKNNTGKKVEHKYLLKGLLKCGVCGRNFYGRTRVSKKDNFYMCSSKRYKELNCKNRSLNIDVLENFVWNRFFLNKEFEKLVNDWIQKEESEPKSIQLNDEIKQVEKELKEVEKKKQKAIKLVLNDLLSEDDLKSELKSIEIKTSDLKVKLSNLKESLSFIENAKEKEKEYKNLNFKNGDFNTKKKIINKYIKEIEILQVGKQRLIQDEKINKYVDEINEKYKRKTEHIIFINFKIPVEVEMYVTSKNVFYRWNEYFYETESIRNKTEKRIDNIEILN